MYRNRPGCLMGLLQLFLLDRVFRWLQGSFGFGRGLAGNSVISSEVPRLELSNPIAADRSTSPRVSLEMFFELAFVDLGAVERRQTWRNASQRANQN